MRPNNYTVEDCYKYADFVFFIGEKKLDAYLKENNIRHALWYNKDNHVHTFLETSRIQIGSVRFTSKIIYV